MNIEIIRGVLIPFLGTVLGAESPDGLCSRCHGGSKHLESADPGHGTVGGNGKMVICPRSSRVLGRHFVFTFAGSCDPASAYEE